MNKLWTIGALLQWTQEFFTKKGIDTPRLDAEILLAHVLKKERIYLYAHYDEPMMENELAAYRELVKKRSERISVAHLIGKKSFMGLDFIVNSDVLIPRPETEMLVETIMSYETPQSEASILDIGTGSGAIILSLLHYLPKTTGTAVDISAAALAVAKQNGAALDLTERVQWIESDLFAHMPQKVYDWIESNPPYLTQQDMKQLQPEVKHDPAGALYGGPDGLEFYRRLSAEAWQYLAPTGHCAVEIGAGQSQAVTDIFVASGKYSLDKMVKDYGGIERVLVFARKG